jgi:hypothetical protein
LSVVVDYLLEQLAECIEFRDICKRFALFTYTRAIHRKSLNVKIKTKNQLKALKIIRGSYPNNVLTI